jgi:tRNA 2-thiouridine synthesizing protein A
MTDLHETIAGERALVLDVRGLNCPMPLLKAKKALNELPPSALLRVLATDPGSVRDFDVFSRQSGHELLESAEEAGTYRYLLPRSPADGHQPGGQERSPDRAGGGCVLVTPATAQVPWRGFSPAVLEKAVDHVYR